MAIEEFINLVKNMRNSQKKYCKTPNEYFFEECNKFEKRVDDEIERLINPQITKEEQAVINYENSSKEFIIKNYGSELFYYWCNLKK